jgi:uncharacterized membrane protein YfcA
MPGLGILAIPLMIITVGDAKRSAGWLLPVLCTADLFAIYYFRRHAAAGRLFQLMPWVAIGLVGGALALSLTEQVLRPLVAGIILVMLLIYLYRRYHANEIPEAHPIPYGVAAGFSTTVANAAGPVMNLYLLSQRLPKQEFVATGAWFFFFVNLLKVPIYAWHGLFSRASLMFDLAMIPAVLAGALTGRWLLERIPVRVFEWAVIGLTAVSTILIFR